jgi:Ala-tRNA(Pro) deacylase
MATQAWVKQLLTQRGVPYQECHHPDAFTAQEVAQKEHISGHRVAKVVVVIADGRPVELVLPASRRVAFDQLRRVLGVQEVRLATEAEMANYFPDAEVGAMPALDHWKGVEVLMDSTMQIQGDILLQGGTHQDAVRVRFTDWFQAIHPRVDSFSEPAASAHPEQLTSRAG